jgi:hypothetical protein
MNTYLNLVEAISFKIMEQNGWRGRFDAAKVTDEFDSGSNGNAHIFEMAFFQV